MVRVAVAVSGGVDSLCALLLLKEAGHVPIALHALLRPDAAPPSLLASVCARAGIELQIVDLRLEFEEYVMNVFGRLSADGITPNPCAVCNREIKFGALMDHAFAIGADAFATGHYAAHLDGVPARASDSGKDQTYFLSLVQRKRLRRALFPLATQTKAQTRLFVSRAGFEPPQPKESQDVCFLTGSPAGFISGYVRECGGGRVLLREHGSAPLSSLPEIGRHAGLWRYTIGQRRGLGFPWKEPLYVRELHRESGALVLAPRAMLNMKSCRVGALNYFVPYEIWPEKIFARFRYRQQPCAVRAKKLADALEIELLESRLATAPGQIVAIGDADGRILAGGVAEAVTFFP